LDSPNLHHWCEKQNFYTTLEGIAIAEGKQLAARPRLFGSYLERRMFLKQFFFRVPLRYQIQLMYELFGRGAWKDGRRGLEWARLRVFVMRMRELKAREIMNTGRAPVLRRPVSDTLHPRVANSDLQRKALCKSRNF
jgi:hypothetical protein